MSIFDITSWCNISFADDYSNPLFYAHNLYLNDHLITDLVIPNTVTNIGNYAFTSCWSLISISIPNSVTSIGNKAFYECSGLTSITIPSSVTSIGEFAFSDCMGLESFIMYSNAKIDYYPLYLLRKSYSLRYLEIHSDCFYPEAYYDKDELSIYTPIEYLIIGKEVTKIEGNFSFWDNLSMIKVDPSNPVYDSRNDCNAVIKTSSNTLITGCQNTIIPNGITTIGRRAFFNCKGLTSISIPNSVTRIEDRSFCGCFSLTTIDFPEGLLTLGDTILESCTNLKVLHLPSSIQSIGQCITKDCNAITDIYYESKTPFNISNNNFTISTYEKTILHVPYGTSNIYATRDGWKFFQNIVEMEKPDPPINFADAKVKSFCVSNWDTNKDGELSEKEAAAVTTIGTVFQNSQLSSFDELQFFTSLTTIDQGAFSCSTVKSIILPENIITLGKDAFINCRSLTEIHLPIGVQAIGQNALSGCTAMTSITVHKQNEYFCDIDGVLFSKDKTTLMQFPSAKTNVYTIPAGTKVIARDAFLESSLEFVELPTTLTELDNDAFGYCTKLTELTIPEGVTTIGDYILDGCSNLKILHIPTSLTAIGQFITNGCNAITDVYSGNKTPFPINSNNFTKTSYENATLHVPYGKKDLYASLEGWLKFQNISDDITVDPDAHAKCSNMRMGRQFDVAVGFYIGRGHYNGYQFDISLPEGFRLQEQGGRYTYTLSDRYKDDGVSVSITKNANGSYRVLVYSMMNTRIKEADGELIHLMAVADKEMDAGEYKGNIFNAMLSKNNGESIDVEQGFFNLVILPYEIGDTNNDHRIDVSDVMLVVNHILGNTMPFYHGDYADMNGDGIVDVTDIMLIVEVILDPENVYVPSHPTNDGLSLITIGEKTIVKIPFVSDYSACQMTVRLSEGMKLQKAQIYGDEEQASSEIRTTMYPDGSWRVVVYSPDGAPLRFSDEGLLCLKTYGKGQISLSDIVFSTMQCESVSFSDVSNTTEINDTNKDTYTSDNVYDLNGRLHTTIPSQCGIYIRQGKTYTVRK